MVDHRRCAWAEDDALMRAYHDTEWGVPQHDSRMLWEMLMLEGFQAGLAWIIILRKRESFRAAFAKFNPKKVARFGNADITRLMGDAGIVRARAKIEATIGGARAYLAMRDAVRISPPSSGIWWAVPPSGTAARSWQRPAFRENLEGAEDARV